MSGGAGASTEEVWVVIVVIMAAGGRLCGFAFEALAVAVELGEFPLDVILVEADDLFLQVVDIFFIVEGFDSFLNPSVGVVSVVSFSEP